MPLRTSRAQPHRANRVLLACVWWEGGAEARGGVGSRRDSSPAIASEQRSELLAVLCSSIWMLRSHWIICAVSG